VAVVLVPAELAATPAFPTPLLLCEPRVRCTDLEILNIVQNNNVMDLTVVLKRLELVARIIRTETAMQCPSLAGASSDRAVVARGGEHI
jgi:hypothetical protein